MPLESFRFIHAAGLRLDHQLEGVPPLSKSARAVAEEASILAFEQIVDACLTHEVDFLLLSGNSFDQQDAGVRGQAILARELERLMEHDIATFLIAGDKDPWPAWLSGVRYSEGVEFLGRDQNSSAPFHVHGKPVALVYPLVAPAGGHTESSLRADTPLGPQGSATVEDFLPIGMMHGELAQLDGTLEVTDAETNSGPRISGYQAWGGGTRQTRRIGNALAHDPGAPQAFHAGQTGPHGCTLVEVDASGSIKLEMLPTAPVRWEHCTVHLAPHLHSEEDLLAAMRTALAEIQRCESDQVWLVTWTLHAEGALPEIVRDAKARRELFERLSPKVEIEYVIVATQDVRVHVGAPGPGLDAPADSLFEEYTALVAERLGGEQWSASQCLNDSVLHDGPWEPRLEGLVPHLKRQRIEECARRLGQEWFAVEQESSP